MSTMKQTKDTKSMPAKASKKIVIPRNMPQPPNGLSKHKLYVRIPRHYKAPCTTASTHDLLTYPNLVRELIPEHPNWA